MADLRTVMRIIARDETGGVLTKTQSELKGLSTTLVSLRNQAVALAGINFGVGGLAQLIALADGYQLVTSRLKLLSGETENFGAIQADVFDIAQRTFTSYEQTAAIYGNLAASTREIGLESEQLLTITEALTQAYQISGSTQQEAKASTIQLVQALASGQIRGQEFNSVAEQGRRILFALKDATGLSAGELRQFANEGKLTTEFFAKNFLPQAAKIREEFQTMPLTVGRSLTQLQNAFEKFVGEQNQAYGITRELAGVFSDIALNFDSFANTIVTSGEVAVAFLTQRFVAAVGASISKKAEETKASLAAIAAKQSEAAVRLKNAQAAASEIAASQARVAALLAEERATLAAAQALGVAGGQRVAVERQINLLTLQHNALAAARVKADLAVATATQAVTAATVRSTVALRAWNATLAFLGGPVGAVLTGLGLLAFAIHEFDSSVRTGTEAYAEFVDGLNETSRVSQDVVEGFEDIATALDKIKFSQQFSEIALGREAVRLLTQEITDLEEEITRLQNRPRTGGTFEDVTLGVTQTRLAALRDNLADAQKQLDERESSLRRILQDQRDLEKEVSDGGGVSGVPKTLKDALDQQNAANDKLKAIEKDRQKLIDALDEQSKRLSGTNLDPEKQTQAFNIASLNTLRGRIATQIEANDPKGAIESLTKAKAIIDQLEKEGKTSNTYLKTQVDLVRELAKQAGDIEVEKAKTKVKVGLEIDENAIRQEAQNLADAVNPILEAIGFTAKLKVTTDEDVEAAKVAAEYSKKFNEALKQNPGIQPVVVENDEVVKSILSAREDAQNALNNNPVIGVIKWVAEGAAAPVAPGTGLPASPTVINAPSVPETAVTTPQQAQSVPMVVNLDGRQYKVQASGEDVRPLERALNREALKGGF